LRLRHPLALALVTRRLCRRRTCLPDQIRTHSHERTVLGGDVGVVKPQLAGVGEVTQPQMTCVPPMIGSDQRALSPVWCRTTSREYDAAHWSCFGGRTTQIGTSP
jgi:hypothetical protein